MDLWSLLMQMIGKGQIDSPRDALLSVIFEDLTTPQIMTQSYFDILSIFAWVGLHVWVIELVFRAYRALSKSSPSDELRAFGLTTGFLFIGIYALPAIVLAIKLFFDTFGRFVLQALMGTDDPSVMADRLQALTGNPAFDFILGPIQATFLFILYLELYVVVAMVWSATIVLVIGVIFRWVGDFGQALFKFSIRFALYGVAMNFIILLIFGISFGVQAAAFADNQTAKAFLNTAAIIACVLVIPKALTSLKGHFGTVVAGASSTYERFRRKSNDNGGAKYDSTEDNPEETKRSHDRKSRNDKSTTGNARQNPQQQDSRKPGQSDSSNRNPTDKEDKESYKPKEASTAGRSRRPRDASDKPEQQRRDKPSGPQDKKTERRSSTTKQSGSSTQSQRAGTERNEPSRPSSKPDDGAQTSSTRSNPRRPESQQSDSPRPQRQKDAQQTDSDRKTPASSRGSTQRQSSDHKPEQPDKSK